MPRPGQAQRASKIHQSSNSIVPAQQDTHSAQRVSIFQCDLVPHETGYNQRPRLQPWWYSLPCSRKRVVGIHAPQTRRMAISADQRPAAEAGVAPEPRVAEKVRLVVEPCGGRGEGVSRQGQSEVGWDDRVGRGETGSGVEWRERALHGITFRRKAACWSMVPRALNSVIQICRPPAASCAALM